MLISPEELANYLGVTFTPSQQQRASEIIADISGLIQDYCTRIQLTRIEDDEVTLTGSYSYELMLPLGPVVEVSEVLIDGSAVNDWDLIGDRLIRTGLDDQITVPFRHPTTPHWGGTDVAVTVTYTHGFAVAPPAAKAICKRMAAQQWDNPSGIRSRSVSIDGYSETVSYAAGESAGAILTPADERRLNRYRITARSARTS